MLRFKETSNLAIPFLSSSFLTDLTRCGKKYCDRYYGYDSMNVRDFPLSKQHHSRVLTCSKKSKRGRKKKKYNRRGVSSSFPFRLVMRFSKTIIRLIRERNEQAWYDNNYFPICSIFRYARRYFIHTFARFLSIVRAFDDARATPNGAMRRSPRSQIDPSKSEISIERRSGLLRSAPVNEARTCMLRISYAQPSLNGHAKFVSLNEPTFRKLDFSQVCDFVEKYFSSVLGVLIGKWNRSIGRLFPDPINFS